jgi:transposase-like protein
MRVRARIPSVEPAAMNPPNVCPNKKCQGEHFKVHQKQCKKSVRDTQLEQVEVYRRKCLSCGQTHRVYPQGVSNAQQTERLKGVSILLYVLGISYRGTEDFLNALGFFLSYSSIYRNVQAAGEQVGRLKKAWYGQGNRKIKVVGGDLSYLQCKGDKVVVGLAIDAQEGVLLDIEVLDNEETDTIQAWLQPLLELVGAEVLITDDQDGFKAVADDAGVNHQICQQHAKPNVLDFVAKAAEKVLDAPPTVPEELDVTPDQLLEDLATLEWIALGHPGQGAKLLGEMYDRYAHAPAPKKRKRASIWYRMRNHILRLWNNWKRHTCYRAFMHNEEFTVAETNNGTERVIGWDVKERYRTMRGYKRDKSLLNVSLLTAWLHEQPKDDDMRLLFSA